MDPKESRSYLDLQQFKYKSLSTIHKVLEKNPVFIFVDDKEDTFVANYIGKEKTVIYAYANPVKILLFLISRKVGIDLFEDACLQDLEKAINDVLKTYNIHLEDEDGRIIQSKIPSDGSSKHQ